VQVVVRRLIRLLTLLVVSLLLLISTFAYSIGEVLGSVSNALINEYQRSRELATDNALTRQVRGGHPQ
jgi:hypothetical protein